MAGSGFLTAEPSTMPGTGNRLEEFEGLPTEEVAADKATEYFAQLTPSLLPPFLLQGPVSRVIQIPLSATRGQTRYEKLPWHPRSWPWPCFGPWHASLATNAS